MDPGSHGGRGRATALRQTQVPWEARLSFLGLRAWRPVRQGRRRDREIPRLARSAGSPPRPVAIDRQDAHLGVMPRQSNDPSTCGSGSLRSNRRGLSQARGAPLLLVLFWGLIPAPTSLTAQTGGTDRPFDATEYEAPAWAVQVGLAGANALLGGTVVTLARWARGESLGDAFREGFGPGALTGVLAYGGKRVAVERFTGAGFLGRQIHGVAAASARNVARGGQLTDDLTLFVGPLRLHVIGGVGPGQARWSVSGLDLYWLVYGIADSRFTMDWEASLSAGAPVFRPDRGRRLQAGSGDQVGGAALGGVIFLSDGLGEEEPRLFAHERIHILQFDYLHTVISQPIEAAVLDRVGGWTRVPGVTTMRDRLHPDLLFLGMGVLLGPRAESRRAPWEVEAYLLEGRP